MPHHLTVPRVCEQCGEPFLAEGYLVKRGVARFCGKACANRYNAARHRPEEAFWSRVDKSGSCWLWTGPRDGKGYGRFTARYVHWLTHRYAWVITNGAIPEGLNVLHNCPDGDNPACVNPAHLFLGTTIDNNADMRAKNRHTHGEQSPHARLTESDVRAIRTDYATGAFSFAKLARRYGVSFGVVYRVVNRQAWRHVA